jgi:4-amino-4-deoxy-L-arabinose transferase-like glycosyltransferase
MALHLAVALSIQAFAPGFGGGFVTGDDASYFRLSSHFADYLRGVPADPGYGPPYWGGDAFLFGTFAYLETALFLVFGPDVRVALILNAGIAVATALLVYAIALRLFSGRAALVAASVVAFYPSLLLWSSLNLKDPLTIALVVIAVWSMVAFRRSPHLLTLLLPFAAAELLVTLRSYAAATIAIAALMTFALVRLPTLRRIATVILASSLTVALVLQSLGMVGLRPDSDIFAAMERIRSAMGAGANTAFVPTAPPVTAAPVTAAPVTAAPVTAAPVTAVPVTAAPVTTTLSPIATVSARTTPGTPVPAARTLSYLPVGLAYALFAPFPLFATRLQELIAAPEMVFWYGMLVAATITLWRDRRRWHALVALVLTFSGLLALLALVEGNTGTLFRHRGMLIPLVALLASPTLAGVLSKVISGRIRAPTDRLLPHGLPTTDRVSVGDVRRDPHIS